MIPPSTYAPNTALADLRTPEIFLVITLRLYALNWREPGLHPAWWGGFAAIGLPPAASTSFLRLFGIVVAGPRRSLDVRCLHCTRLGYDEGRLLQLVSLFQHGRGRDAEAILGEWLLPAACRLAVPAATGLARALRGCNLILPWRCGEAIRVPAHQLSTNPGLARVQ